MILRQGYVMMVHRRCWVTTATLLMTLMLVQQLSMAHRFNQGRKDTVDNSKPRKFPKYFAFIDGNEPLTLEKDSKTGEITATPTPAKPASTSSDVSAKDVDELSEALEELSKSIRMPKVILEKKINVALEMMSLFVEELTTSRENKESFLKAIKTMEETGLFTSNSTMGRLKDPENFDRALRESSDTIKRICKDPEVLHATSDVVHATEDLVKGFAKASGRFIAIVGNKAFGMELDPEKEFQLPFWKDEEHNINDKNNNVEAKKSEAAWKAQLEQGTVKKVIKDSNPALRCIEGYFGDRHRQAKP